VHLIDERLSTVTAASSLRESGRDSREQRSVIDQAAAVVILQHFLDSRRARS
jgi:putative Holliday junction resolvase